MEQEITTETEPRLFKSGRLLPVDALVADPSIAVIEVGRELGFLLSESCHYTATRKFILEDVTWCRYKIRTRSGVAIRTFGKTALYLHSSSVFVVQDTLSELYLPNPSSMPYWIAFITKEMYFELKNTIKRKTMNRLTELVAQHTRELPGFSYTGGSISAPPDYASTTDADLEHGIIKT